MGKALIIGAGGVASVVVHKCCQNSEVFEEICICLLYTSSPTFLPTIWIFTKIWTNMCRQRKISCCTKPHFLVPS